MLGLSVGVGAKLSPFVSREVSAVVKSRLAKLRMYWGMLGILWV